MSRAGPALLIDASEWFVDESWRAHVTARHWRRLPRRGVVALGLLAARLAALGARATICVEAATAARDPELMRELRRAGHELALLLPSERALHELDADAARRDLLRSLQAQRVLLERALGTGVHGFAAAWSVAASPDPWWRQELWQLGFAYDATPVQGREQTIALADGRELPVARFVASELDREQPRLRGLPAAARREHEQRLLSADARLRAACGRGRVRSRTRSSCCRGRSRRRRRRARRRVRRRVRRARGRRACPA